MKIPSFFKTPKHKRFEFKPRYYNPEKEAFEERIRQAQLEGGEQSGEAEAVKERIRQKFRSHKKNRPASDNRSRVTRIAIIFLSLLALFYWLLK